MKKNLQYYKELKYKIIIEELDDGYYEAYINELGRWTCTAAGITKVEAIEHLKALKDWLIEDWYKRDEIIPEPENIGRSISRSNALKLTNQILIDAEQERKDVTELEASKGIILEPNEEIQMNKPKTLDVVARFIELNNGGFDINYIVKLIYLAERASFDRWNCPFTGDILIATKNGMVLGNMYNFIMNNPSKIISNYSNLSRRELSLIEEIYKTYSKWSLKQLEDYTCKLPEYRVLYGQSIQISLVIFLNAIGKNTEQIKDIIDQIYYNNCMRQMIQQVEANK